ncbi:hypothetical protein [Blastomonas sp. CCH5-A3]|jgi:hypothetical protein|uniref:hypothetical protein n=1 Tax=Blastomonas sp. CCH5-A3 TaxID=1768761 RepID=UPI0008268410|nr:hypothetical protein [Blastomonas sp. CCH5-A3]MAF60198.1 hypothetical protein [Blastomonas sp.]|tara:strand:+ start:129202 stop:133623 length:4422 start_codon:yes stop_codon:yes gene_type:complete
MSKVLKTVGVIVGAVGAIALVISSAGLAAPLVGAAAGTTAAATATATFATVGTIASGVAAAAQIGSGLLAKPPRAQGTTSGLSIAPNQPTPCLMGETYFDGILTWDTGYGGRVSKVDNPYRFMVVEYSGCGPVDELVQIYANFQPVYFSGNAATGYYSGFLYRDVRLGAVPESSPVLPQWPGAPRWSMQHKASGHAQIGYSLRFDKDGKVWANGVPRIGALWRGVRRYDPRLDSTYPGGSGPCRIDDPSTYVYTANNALHALGYAYGTYHNGKKVFGVDGDFDAIDVDTFVAWANAIDANGWSIGGQIFEPGDKWNNLKLICQSGAAEPVLLGSTLSVRFSAPRIAIGRITADDLADGELVIPGSPDWRDAKNVIIPKFRSAAHQWTYQPAGEVAFSNYVELDGERKVDTVQFDLIQNADQATQVGSYYLADKRELGPITLPLKPRCSSFRPGDCVTVHIPSEGLTEQLCIVSGRSLDPGSGIVQLTFITETEEKHDFALGRSGTPPPVPQLVSAEELDGTRKVNLAQAPIEYSADFTFDLGDVAILPDGSTWLFISTTPQTGSAPAIGNPHWLQLTGQVEPVYADGTPMRDLQPAEPNATDGAVVPTPGSGVPGNIKDENGNIRPPGQFLNSSLVFRNGKLDYLELPDAEPINLGRVTTADIGAATASSLRQADDSIARLAATATFLLSESSRTRELLRDGGIYVDPVTKQVRIHSVEQTRERLSKAEITLDGALASINLKASFNYVNEQIALAAFDPSQIADLSFIFSRLNEAEIDIDGLNAAIITRASASALSAVTLRVNTAEQKIDALEGQISDKVGSTEFNALDTRVSQAEELLEAVPDAATIRNSVTATRLVQLQQEENAEKDLIALVLSDRAKRSQVQAIGIARNELGTRISDQDGRIRVVAEFGLALQVELGRSVAGLTAQSVALADDISAVAQDLTNLQTSFDGQFGTLQTTVDELGQAFSTEQETSGLRFSEIESTIGQQGEELEAIGARVENVEQTSANIDGRLTAGLQRSATVGRINDIDLQGLANRMLQAVALTDRNARKAFREVAFFREEIVTDFTANKRAVASSLVALGAELSGAIGQITELSRVVLEPGTGLVQQINTLSLSTTLAISQTRQDLENTISTTRGDLEAVDANTIGRVDGLEDDLGTAVDLIGEVSDGLAAEVAARPIAIEAAITEVRQILQEADRLIVEAFDRLVGRVGDNETTILQYAQIVDGILGKWGVEVDNNGLIGGLTLLSTLQRLDLDFNVTKVTMRDPASGFIYFEATEDGVVMRDVEVDTIKADVIDATQMKGWAMGERSQAYDVDPVNTNGANWVNVITIGLTPLHGRPIKLNFAALMKDIVDANTKLNVRIIRDDGTVIYGGPGGAEFHIQDEGTQISIPIFDSVDAGRATTWSMQFAKSTEPNVTVAASFRMAEAEELSRVNLQSSTINTGGAGGPGAGDPGGGFNPNPPGGGNPLP